MVGHFWNEMYFSKHWLYSYSKCVYLFWGHPVFKKYYWILSSFNTFSKIYKSVVLVSGESSNYGYIPWGSDFQHTAHIYGMLKPNMKWKVIKFERQNQVPGLTMKILCIVPLVYFWQISQLEKIPHFFHTHFLVSGVLCGTEWTLDN